MTSAGRRPALDVLILAKRAFQNGDRQSAYQLARQAALLDPALEEAWLILAALSANPDTSLQFLQRAIRINPASQRARRGIQWALQRKRKAEQAQGKTGPLRLHGEPGAAKITSKTVPNRPAAPAKRKSAPKAKKRSTRLFISLLLAGLASMIILCLAMGLWLIFSQDWVVLAGGISIENPAGLLQRPTLTSTSTASPTLTTTPTSTPTDTPTATQAPTETPTPTATETETPTPLPTETATEVPTEAPPPAVQAYSGGERWVEINLSQQMLYAYEGGQIINGFIISSGTATFPTVTGDFRVYAMYRYSTMAGDDYYLPDVPYAMYFYKGYAMHGTYWHSNFGTPMSHGCVNLRTEDAAWLYEWVSVGTPVSVHY